LTAWGPGPSRRVDRADIVEEPLGSRASLGVAVEERPDERRDPDGGIAEIDGVAEPDRAVTVPPAIP
jgi:hypothetical protein